MRVYLGHGFRPFVSNDSPQPDNSILFHNLIAKKRILKLNPTHPLCQEVLLDLVS